MELHQIQTLIEERNSVIKSARDMNDAALAEKRSLSAEEKTKWETMMARADELRDIIAREERVREASRLALGSADVAAPAKSEPMDKLYRQYILGKISHSEYERQAKPLCEARALQMDSPTAGGYLTPPPALLDRLVKAVDNQTFVRQLGTKITCGAEGIGAPALDNDPADTTWAGEIATVSEDSTMTFGKRSLTPHSMNKLLKVSAKLLRNAAGAEALVMDRLGYKAGITFETAAMTGTGAQQALGVFTASDNGISTGRDQTCTVAVGANTDFADVLDVDIFKKAKWSLNSGYLAKAVWIMHRDVASAVDRLKDGNGQYLWQPSNQLGQPDRFLNHPVYLSEYAPSTVAVSSYVALFGDLSYYWIAESLSPEVQRLQELYAATSQVGFILRAEMDGMPVLESAFARVKTAAA